MPFLSSVKSLYAAVGILFLTVISGTYVDRRHDALAEQRFEINLGIEKMHRLNQHLNNMLVFAAMDKNMLKAASYESVKTEFEQALQSVVAVSKTLDSNLELVALTVGSGGLRSQEDAAMVWVNSGRWTEASSIIFGDEYVLARKVFDVDSSAASQAVTNELFLKVDFLDKIRKGSIALRISSLFFLLGVGIMFSRKTSADLAQQKALREEISGAYQGMELRVQERTADLETSTQKLAAENENRAKSDNRTRLILGSVDQGIFGVDFEGLCTFINNAAEKLLGFSADELVGQEIVSLIHHSRADGSPLATQDCPMHVNHPSSGKHRKVSAEVLWRKDGSWFFSEYSVTPYQDETGQLTGAVVVFRDISEQQKNQEELQNQMNELQRFNLITMGREIKMIELKEEINVLLDAQGAAPKYKIVAEQ